MAIKQFALPLNDKSIQSGDITFAELVANAQPVTFKLTNITAGAVNALNLITQKGGTLYNHNFNATAGTDFLTVALSANQMAAVFNDADDVDRDYIEACWTTGAVDTPATSNSYEIQSGHTYNLHFWPPKSKSDI
ncbi:MAG TPA: hypothetical protein VGL38_01085 [bacterium]|jgi:hypothetical protein